MDIYDIFYLPDSEIETILQSCSAADIHKTFGVQSERLVKWMKVKRWLYEVNLKEQLSKRLILFSERDIKKAEVTVQRTLNEFSDRHDINVFEDLIYFNNKEIETLISTCSEEELFKSLITAPDVIRKQIASAATKSLELRLLRNTTVKEIYTIVEIEQSQIRILKGMKGIRERTES